MIKLGDLAKSILDDFVKDPTGKWVRKPPDPKWQPGTPIQDQSEGFP